MIDRIGKYEVQSELGSGAFGRVYAAYDPVTKRRVAIKVLLLESDADMLARFSLEVQATVKLKHKNIVTIYDYNEQPPYIVMELVEGESLQRAITRRAPFGLLQKVRILAQTAEGLAAAHQYGIFHRDIKPANIMVMPSGDVKIMDFGIARVSGATANRRTRKGDLVGTILYMSPERIQGFEADASADIFAFGVVAFELITGTHPFEGKDYASVFYKITSVDPPLMRQTIPECPETLDSIVQRAAAKDRDVRYQSMEELLFDLKPVLLDLERQEAASMMRGVQALIDAGKPEEAQDKLREALQLDPMNREARQIRDSLQRDQQRRLTHAKAQKFVEDGSAQLQQRQFKQAIQSFENAVKLDPDTQIRELLGQARAGLEAIRQASRLLSEAHRELLAGNLDAALGFAAQAVEADPNHQEAGALHGRLGQQIADRDRQIRVEQSLQVVERRLSASDFAGARAALAEVETEADPDLLAELRSRIDAEEAEQARRVREQRAQSGIAKARQQLRTNQLAEAEETLRAILDEFPDATAALKLLATVQEQAESQRRSEAIGKLTQQAIGCLHDQNFAQARRLLEAGLRVYPDETNLQRLLERALDLEKAKDRTEAIGRVLREVQELWVSSKIQDALALVDRMLAEHGPETALTELKRRLESEREQQLYAEGVREALANGRRLLEEGKPSEAVAALQTSAAAYPGEPEIVALLAAARQAQAEEEERQRTSQALARVEQLADRQEWETALQTAEDARGQYPDNPTLTELAARTRASWRERQRQSDLTRRLASVDKALAGGELARAGHDLAALREDFPDEAGLKPLEERLRQAQAEAQADEADPNDREAAALHGRLGTTSNLDQLESAPAKSLPRFPDVPPARSPEDFTRVFQTVPQPITEAAETLELTPLPSEADRATGIFALRRRGVAPEQPLADDSDPPTDGVLTISNCADPAFLETKATVDHFPFTIGRAGSDWDLSFDRAVSSRHVEIDYREGGLFIRDLGSSNGSFVNGRPLKALQPRCYYSVPVFCWARTRRSSLAPDC
jgi:serine/threonine protein kinase